MKIVKIPSTNIFKSQITKHKYQTVRQVHHPEPGRRANHNDSNSKFQTYGRSGLYLCKMAYLPAEQALRSDTDQRRCMFWLFGYFPFI